MDKVPKYKEEDLVVETKEVVVVDEPQESTEPEPIVEDEGKTNLVPPSENPFANPANAAKPIESNGEDYYEDGRKAGEGDKF